MERGSASDNRSMWAGVAVHNPLHRGRSGPAVTDPPPASDHSRMKTLLRGSLLSDCGICFRPPSCQLPCLLMRNIQQESPLVFRCAQAQAGRGRRGQLWARSLDLERANRRVQVESQIRLEHYRLAWPLLLPEHEVSKRHDWIDLRSAVERAVPEVENVAECLVFP